MDDANPAAVLSSKLYEFEKQQSDIYVEKRLLTKRIEDMQAQVRSQRGDASALFHGGGHMSILLTCAHLVPCDTRAYHHYVDIFVLGTHVVAASPCSCVDDMLVCALHR